MAWRARAGGAARAGNGLSDDVVQNFIQAPLTRASTHTNKIKHTAPIKNNDGEFTAAAALWLGLA